MRGAWVLVVALACGGRAGPAAQTQPSGAVSGLTKLPSPPVLDLEAPDAAYRAAVAVHLQPAWAQFLEDCRVRLTATHPLNVMSLATTAEITVDAAGAIVEVTLASSGNPDFDRAVRQVIEDGAPLPKPPAALWGDDDRVHLRWLFARDRRQAGPATASVVEHLLPVREVTTRLLAAGELTRAARRIQREPAGQGRDTATTELMVAGLREALASSDPAARRAAIEAIAQANVGMLAHALYDFIASTADGELRVAALLAAAELGDHAVVQMLLDQLRVDVKSDRKLAVAETEALVKLDASDAVATLLGTELAAPNPNALHALGSVAAPGLFARHASWQRSKDVRVRAGACVALGRAADKLAATALAKGLDDRDASVRAACLDAIATRMAVARSTPATTRIGPAAITRATTLVRDRDDRTRAAAIVALAAIHAEAFHDGEPPKLRAPLPDLAADTSAPVRVAYLRAIELLSLVRPLADGRDRVLPLLADSDADVRAAAWDALVVLLRRAASRIEADPPPADLERLVARARQDAAPQVRRAVIDAIADEVALIRIASDDDDAEVRTRALVRLAERGGKQGIGDLLLGRFAAAAPGSTERVRAALAWHLAR